jgi:hypothetical protein
MFGSMRFSAALAVAAFVAGSAAQAQIAVNPVAAAAARGFGGFSGAAPQMPVGGIGVAGVGGLGNPYGLSTVAGNPYLGGSLGMSPYGVGGYGLSTAPGANPFPYQYNPPYMGYGYRQDPMNGYLTGVASVTSATGEYWINIQKARLLREEARRSSFDTTKKQVELEMWYERLKPKTQDLVDAAVRTDLDRARKDPPMTEVTSGKTLNDLLNNIRKLGRLTRGPNISLEEDTLKHINLAPVTTAGNVGLLKDGGKFSWPLSLHEKQFSEERERLTRNLQKAVEDLKVDAKGDLEPRLLKDINTDARTLAEKVDTSQDDLTISQYLEAKAFMRQLQSAVRSLRDPQVKKYFNNTWNAKGRTVAELVDNMTKDGLSFTAAAPGEEAAYMALYYAVRAFESGLALAQK